MVEVGCDAQLVAGRLTKVELVADAAASVERACGLAQAVGLLAVGGQGSDLD